MTRSNIKRVIATFAISSTIVSCMNSPKIEHKAYPESKRTDVTDNYFGTEVADPYRWLEDDNSAETAAWVAAQNEVTFDYLSQIPYRSQIKDRLTELWNYTKESAPSKKGDYYYYYYNDGLQNQSIIYRKSTLDGEGEVFLNPNTLSEDGTKALNNLSFSEDGKYCAFAIASSGSDWVEISVIDCTTMEMLSDNIKWLKFSGATWAPDSKSFYYSAYDAPKGSMLSDQNQHQRVYLHKLGDNQSQDKLIFEDLKHPLRYHSAEISEDDKWIFINVSEGTSGVEYLYKRKSDKSFNTLLKGFEHDYVLVDCKDDILYIRTNDEAANYRLATLDLNNPKAGLKSLVLEHGRFMLDNVTVGGGYLFLSYLEDAQSKVYQYTYEGELVREVELPAIGTATGFHGKKEDTKLFFTLSNYTKPATVYTYDVTNGSIELHLSPEVGFNPENFTTEQLFFKSTDGTIVPMFVSYRKGIKLNGKNPCYLYGYGGFQINLTPSFNPANIMFMEQGGVHVVVSLRGGSEYGEGWHKAGMLDKKQNVFDDFTSAAEHLIKEGYTSADKLAIAGGSNGGLLVGACMVQRPDLFAVALPDVGVLDMLRYHKFTIGWGWAVEYGSSENEEQFNYIYKYSPLHNIKDGVNYPATMVGTGDHDDRVVPAHSFKFAAQLQHSDGGENPILIRVETNAGHGAGKPTSKKINELADQYSFILYNTNSKYTEIK